MRNRKALMLVAAVLVMTVAGCVPAREHRRQIGSLQDSLDAREEELSVARGELEGMRRAFEERTGELGRVRARAEELAELSERLEQAKAERERNLREMQDLVREISGMRIAQRAEGDFIVIESGILFDSGKRELKEGAKESIQKVVPYIKDQLAKDGDLMIRIDGHTDGQPIRLSGWDDNHHLSVLRAHSVMTYLAEEGISRRNMFLTGYGPNLPMVEPPTHEDAVSENRRVEILLVPSRDDDIQRILEEFVR